MQIPIAQRDMYLSQIQEEIRGKKQLLIKKRKELDKKQQMNHFLGDVKSDYAKYYEYIVQEKQQQYDAMMLLKEYLNDLVKTEKLVNNQLTTVKYDQKEILSEIDRLKIELDELIRQK